MICNYLDIFDHSSNRWLPVVVALIGTWVGIRRDKIDRICDHSLANSRSFADKRHQYYGTQSSLCGHTFSATFSTILLQTNWHFSPHFL